MEYSILPQDEESFPIIKITNFTKISSNEKGKDLEDAGRVILALLRVGGTPPADERRFRANLLSLVTSKKISYNLEMVEGSVSLKGAARIASLL